MASIDPVEPSSAQPLDEPKVSREDTPKEDPPTTKANTDDDERDLSPAKEPSIEEVPGEQGDENPPLPPGPPPEESTEGDDGWTPLWDSTYGSYYFYNTITGETTWTNPRVPEATADLNVPATASNESTSPESATPQYDPLQYNPAIHGDYDPTAPYAQVQEPVDDAAQYTATAAFNRFTGKFQPSSSRQVPEAHNDENKSRRQMEFYFDVDAAANSHDGKSLKAERQTKKLTKKELKQFKEKRRARKEEKRKAWLKD
ncbi:hypothetical protein BDD12DRAFT_731797 [Trichophaea hybrida]|nr:hypothetical protein BDD12DRAFT_731797 [Trichophaea hybrida]